MSDMPHIMQFKILVYPSEHDDIGAFTAHCLNMDVLADDDTVEGAVSNLLETIEATLRAAAPRNAGVFRDAPRQYWQKLARAKKLPAELIERIARDANKRLSPDRRTIDLESMCELRQLEPA